MSKYIRKGYTFDDLLLVPKASNVLPKDVILQTEIAKKINLKIPIISAAMDTVTEFRMAIVLANLGGIGIIHKNMSINDQTKQVLVVKNYSNSNNLPSTAATDNEGKLLVGAAIGIASNTMTRAATLVKYGADILCLDTAHGHSESVIKTLRELKRNFRIPIIVGNVATYEAANALVSNGADCIKVGIGPGSICTTRIVAGIGVPQMTAIMDVARYCNSVNIPVIADGGIKHSGDITKALAAGANAVMLGSLLAGCEEAPGEIIQVKNAKYKEFRGMGSQGAMKAGSSDRYFQEESKKYVPEGVAGYKPLVGKLENIIFNLMGGLRSGMAYCGSQTIKQLQISSEFISQSNAGLIESNYHDVLLPNSLNDNKVSE